MTTRVDKPSNALTPWGVADWQCDYGDGVTLYGTPSHGGFHVTGDALERISPSERARAFLADTHPGWFEEDCDWSIVALSLPELFTAEQIAMAVTVRDWSDNNGNL